MEGTSEHAAKKWKPVFRIKHATNQNAAKETFPSKKALPAALARLFYARHI
jgi:hypothetical protein